jgi:hypothetical protein
MKTVTVACRIPNGLRIGDYLVNGNHPANGRETLGGYAFTDGFPCDVWEKWLIANASSTMVQNDLIFADLDPNVVRMKIRGLVGPRMHGD